jgi:hypothetical protein
VVPLTRQPVVWKGVGADQSSWLTPAVDWYDHPSRWDVVPAADGPATWTRVPIGAASVPSVPEPPVTVSDVRQTEGGVSFHVDRVGVPVEVRISYFPNWQASGAEGPYRVAPNLMVVVPTSNDVSLTYGNVPADWVGQALTVISLIVVIALAIVGWRAGRARRARRAAGATR